MYRNIYIYIHIQTQIIPTYPILLHPNKHNKDDTIWRSILRSPYLGKRGPAPYLGKRRLAQQVAMARSPGMCLASWAGPRPVIVVTRNIQYMYIYIYMDLHIITITSCPHY